MASKKEKHKVRKKEHERATGSNEKMNCKKISVQLAKFPHWKQ